MRHLAPLLLVACGRVDPAPADIDGLSRWYWVNFEAASDDELAEAVENTHTAIDADALDEAIDGSLADLADDDVAHVEVADGTDPTLAAGFFLARTIACPLDDIETIVTALDQDALYVGVYDAYARTYTTDDAAYFARETPRLDWQVEIDSRLLGTPYHETLHGGIRRVDAAASLPHGPVLLTRTWMPNPATFEEGSNKSFDQDYQIELYYERAPGETVHLYALWRALDMGSGVDQDNENAQRVILNNLADWDDGTEEICAGLTD